MGSYGAMVAEGERVTKRRVVAIRNGRIGSDGGENNEGTVGYIGVYTTLRVEKRRDGPATP